MESNDWRSALNVLLDVSVPLRGLVLWKVARFRNCPGTPGWSFSPLAGISFVESPLEVQMRQQENFGFSPLAGISFVESLTRLAAGVMVSYVSVPLRGLVLWKEGSFIRWVPLIWRFSPLAGISFVES